MIVTLLTDFGTADYFVGAMKGAVLSVNPSAQVVDLTHEIPAHDVEAGAYALLASYETFPAGTVHVAVVDPGVGSERRPILAEGGGHYFVGPDNGLFGHVFERLELLRVFHLTNSDFFRPTVSSTFHGRDLFAPVAGHVSRGVMPEDLGVQVEDYVRLARAMPRSLPDGTLEGSVLHVDRFGNCVTNFLPGDVTDEDFRRGAILLVGDEEVRRLKSYYAEDDEAPGEPFAIQGSAGFLEVSVFRGSAADRLKVRRGDAVKLIPAR